MGLRVIQNAYFLFLKHTKQILLFIICHTSAGISKGMEGQEVMEGGMEGQTDVKVETVM